jgi:hypothetical protein
MASHPYAGGGIARRPLSMAAGRSVLSQKETANLISQTGLYLCRQLPTLLDSCGADTLVRRLWAWGCSGLV